jgi:DNA-binding PadR family transcriptional regulator
MEIQYAILGLLSEKPLSGYDLKKIIAESDLFYWSGNNNQIYNSLVQLHQDGMVTVEVHAQESLPARKVYTITGAGREMLRHWMLADPELPELHYHFLIQLAFTALLSDKELDGLLGRYEQEVDVQLRMRVARAENQPAPQPAPREQLVWQHINSAMLEASRRELEWVRALRKDLKERTSLQENEP